LLQKSQKASRLIPGKEKESNWLPAPEGTFSLYIRVYAGDGTWKPPTIEKVK
jgi:hypothetical protein